MSENIGIRAEVTYPLYAWSPLTLVLKNPRF